MDYLSHFYYNIPSNNRELQLGADLSTITSDYNIPSNNRELQQSVTYWFQKSNYNIPSNNRELQLNSYEEQKDIIITYQVITGNYNWNIGIIGTGRIITYQVITGNYNV